MVFGSSACQFKVLDIERISERLFDQEKIREKLCGTSASRRMAIR